MKSATATLPVLFQSLRDQCRMADDE